MGAQDRFWAKVDRSGDCWLWTGALAEFAAAVEKTHATDEHGTDYRAAITLIRARVARTIAEATA